MRGSRFIDSHTLRPYGIIPAHAGLTESPLVCFGFAWDHPRACGAHSFLIPAKADTLGSSPRMRGSLFAESGEEAILGIIPAHAGLTLVSARSHMTARDHPRACGAHLVFFRA